MDQKPLVQTLGSGLLLGTLVLVESLPGAEGRPHRIPILVATFGFALFAARGLVALGPVKRHLGSGRRFVAGAIVAGLMGVLLWESILAAGIVLAILLFLGGLLVAEFFSEVAEFCARPPAVATRRPLAFGASVLGVATVAGAAHYFLPGYLYDRIGDTPLTSGFGLATIGLHLAVLVLLGLTVAACFGRGREALPGRVLYTVPFLYLLAWFVGYSMEEVLQAEGQVQVPLLALGIIVVELVEILFEAPQRLAGAGRALPREALWDVFLAAAFGVVLILTASQTAGMPVAQNVLWMRALVWVGLLAGLVLVPLSRWRAGRAGA